MSTILAWVQSILGTYNPVTYEVTTYVGDQEIVNEIVAEGLAGVDWQYIVTALLLLVTVYSVFRMLGVLLQAVGGGRR